MPPVRTFVLLAALLFAAMIASPVKAAGGGNVFEVDTNLDSLLTGCLNATPTDCTLRGALTKAALGQGNTIRFDLPNCPSTPASCIISPATPLPHITQMTTIIDGTQQPGYTNFPLVVVDGTSISSAGFNVDADNAVISGLEIRNFHGLGIAESSTQQDFTVDFSDIHDNISGGILAAVSHSLTLDGDTISDNTNYGVQASASTMTTATIQNNTITDNDGPGLEITVSGDLTFTNNDISGNRDFLLLPGDGIKASGSTTTNVTFTNNQINNNDGAGAIVAVGTKLDLTGNKITFNGEMGLQANANTMTDATLTSNEISHNGDLGAKLAVSNSLGVDNNVFAGNAMAGLDSSAATTSSVTTTHNDFLGNGSGALFIAGTTTAVHFNRFVGNVDSGAVGEFGTTLNVTNNWWGCNEGPLQAGCDNAFSADYDPWLVLGVDADPSTVLPGAQSTITADVTHNSDGADTSGSGHLRDNHIDVLFATDIGNIDGSPTDSGTLSSGKSTDVFNAPNSPGTAHVSVTLDNETVTTNVLVQSAATPTPTPTSSGSATPSPSPSGTASATPSPTPAGSHTQGDLNCSGHIDGFDALLPLYYSTGAQPVQGECPAVGSGIPYFGDMDCNGDITTRDMIRILKYVIGLHLDPIEGCTPIGSALP